jgi:hypothetical protein
MYNCFWQIWLFLVLQNGFLVSADMGTIKSLYEKYKPKNKSEVSAKINAPQINANRSFSEPKSEEKSNLQKDDIFQKSKENKKKYIQHFRLLSIIAKNFFDKNKDLVESLKLKNIDSLNWKLFFEEYPSILENFKSEIVKQHIELEDNEETKIFLFYIVRQYIKNSLAPKKETKESTSANLLNDFKERIKKQLSSSSVNIKKIENNEIESESSAESKFKLDPEQEKLLSNKIMKEIKEEIYDSINGFVDGKLNKLSNRVKNLENEIKKIKDNDTNYKEEILL